MLQNLLILDGERLSYRTLDVEQIGSVYETMMGFNLEVAQGRSIAIKPTKPHGAPTTINLEELLAVKPADRAKWLKEQTDQALTGQAADRAEGRRRRPRTLSRPWRRRSPATATPNIVPPGAMVLQPSDERRRSRLALHAAVAHRADRPHDAPSRSWSGSARIRRPSRSST